MAKKKVDNSRRQYNDELKAEGSSITEGIGQGRITKNLEGAPIDHAEEATLPIDNNEPFDMLGEHCLDDLTDRRLRPDGEHVTRHQIGGVEVERKRVGLIVRQAGQQGPECAGFLPPGGCC